MNVTVFIRHLTDKDKEIRAYLVETISEIAKADGIVPTTDIRVQSLSDADWYATFGENNSIHFWRYFNGALKKEVFRQYGIGVRPNGELYSKYTIEWRAQWPI